MKSFLVPSFPSIANEAMFGAAIDLARRLGGHLTGIATDSPFSLGTASVQFIGEADIRYVQERAVEHHAACKRIFLDAMAAADVPRLPRTDPGFGYDWIDRGPGAGLTIPEHARVFDLTFVARPGKDAASGQAALLDECLFESGRPVLVMPPAKAQDIGKHIVIAWNNSTETARTVALGSGFLQQADRITVLGVEGVGVQGPGAPALATQLVRNGWPATAQVASLNGRSGGQAFLEEAERLGADMMFKGAYTQSRLRQMVFGGATAFLLANVTMPMFMAH